MLGFSYTNHEFFPEKHIVNGNNFPDTTENFLLDTTFNFSERTRVNETYFYVEDNIKISKRFNKYRITYRILLSNQTNIRNLNGIYTYLIIKIFLVFV